MFRKLKPIIVKEFRQIRRDRTSLGMLLAVPAAMIMLVGYAINFDVKHVPLAVFDQNKTSSSRAYLEKFKHSEYFTYAYEAESYDEIDRLFLHGEARVAVVVPRNFAQDVLSGRTVHVQILVDGSDANSGVHALSNSARMTSTYSAHLVEDAFTKMGRSVYLPIDFRPRIWYNPDLLSNQYMLPGLIGFILVLTAVVSTSMTVVREKERGTMEQIMVSPLKPVHLILGKTIPYMLISLIAATAILIIGYFLFDIQVKGSMLVLYAGIFTIILGALGQGLLISTVTDSQQVAFMMSITISLLPSFLLSGFVFPISSMPVVLQIISNISINKFFLVIVRGVMLKGDGFAALWEQFVYLGIFVVVTLGISTKRMQKRTL